MLEGFKRTAKELTGSIGKLADTAAALGHEKMVESLNEITERLSGNRFHLVVLGQFKRGKSTFINSLLGEDLLPTSVVPLTSIVTLIKHGEKESVEVVFENGTSKPISKGELRDYVTERGNPGNQKGVRRVEVSYPSPYLEDGVFIIDTPGVGSTFENNTEMTYSFLPRVDAAIFMLAVDPPISHSEIAFLKDIGEHVEKVFFIQNKIDYLSEEEQDESLAFSRDAIEEATGSREVKIFPISAKLALEAKLENSRRKREESKIDDFDRALGEFLSREKGKTVLKSTLNKTLKLLSDVEFGIELEKKAITTPLDDLNRKIGLFEGQMERLREERQDNAYLFEGEVNRLLSMLERDVARMREEVTKTIVNEMEGLSVKKRHLGTAEYHSQLKDAMHKRLVAVFDEWTADEEVRLNREYARISRRFSERTNEIIDAILDASQELFDLELERFSSEESMSDDSGFYYLLGDSPRFFDVEKMGKYLARSIMPSGLSHGKALKDLKKELAEKVDKHSGRVRHDFSERLKKSFLKFRWDLNLKVDATEEGIRSAIEKAVSLKSASKKEVDKETRKLAGFSGRLKEIRTGLDRAGESIKEL